MAMSFVRLSAALRMTNRLNHAQRALEIAFETAPPDLKGHLYRARARLRIYQGRLPEAVQDARASVRLTTGESHALALSVLGVALDYSGEHQAATLELERCLAELDPKDEWRHGAILVSYAIALSKGTDADAQRALEICAQQTLKVQQTTKDAAREDAMARRALTPEIRQLSGGLEGARYRSTVAHRFESRGRSRGDHRQHGPRFAPAARDSPDLPRSF